MLFVNSKAKKSSALSDFVRNKSSREKKRIYMTALKEATEAQSSIMTAAAKVSHEDATA